MSVPNHQRVYHLNTTTPSPSTDLPTRTPSAETELECRARPILEESTTPYFRLSVFHYRVSQYSDGHNDPESVRNEAV